MSFTDREFRDALGRFATGVAVVTAEVDGMLLGSTVSSFNSVSLAPPLILFSLARSAQSFALWRKATRFGVTVLGESQNDLSNRFARGGAEKWTDIAPIRGSSGVPLLRGGLACFECETYALYEGGDHEIVVGRVLSFNRSEARPLLFYGGRYHRLHSDRPIESPADLDVWLHGW
jgi:3-hydroxy-9,10-secoandrosta-1,3,5(10)-triene-9,17-dione monooxygenase reductase component